jgi:hypothetical protein
LAWGADGGVLTGCSEISTQISVFTIREFMSNTTALELNKLRSKANREDADWPYVSSISFQSVGW